MTREEEIRKASENWVFNEQGAVSLTRAFQIGAQWADEHPESKYNISDTDAVKVCLEDIIHSAERLTSGNLAHNRAAIKLYAESALRHLIKISK